MTSTSYQIHGMTCEHCVRAVTSEIGAITGVRTVAVDLATGRVTVTSDQPIASASIRAAVDEAGYLLA
jgi:copper ion binding protein